MNQVDPYAIQRVALHKAIFIATILTFIYWFFRPENFLMFVAPLIVTAWYEMPFLSSQKEKNETMVFIFTSVITTAISFYLIYPFKLVFPVYAIILFIILFSLIWTRRPKIRNVPMLIISIGALSLSIQPMASLQIGIGIFSSMILSMLVLLICLNLYPNVALIIWTRAMQHYIRCIEGDITATIEHLPLSSLSEEVQHVDIVRSYQTLLPKTCFSPAFKLYFNIRNIQFALNSIYYQEMNPLFWNAVKNHLQELRQHMSIPLQIDFSTIVLNPSTPFQHLINTYLLTAIRHWNALCKK